METIQNIESKIFNLCSLCEEPTLSTNSFVFSCCHILCHKCAPYLILSLLETESLSNSFFAKIIIKFQCACCKLGTIEIPLSVISNIMKKSSPNRAKNLCEFCEEREKQCFCRDCKQSYCFFCLKSHHKPNKKWINHIISNEAIAYFICKCASKFEIVMFCLDCHCSFCKGCEKNHFNHKIQKIDMIYAENDSGNILEKQKIFSKIIEDLQISKKTFKNQKNEYQSSLEKIIFCLHKLKQNSEKKYKTIKKNILWLQNSLSRLIEDLDQKPMLFPNKIFALKKIFEGNNKKITFFLTSILKMETSKSHDNFDKLMISFQTLFKSLQEQKSYNLIIDFEPPQRKTQLKEMKGFAGCRNILPHSNSKGLEKIPKELAIFKESENLKMKDLALKQLPLKNHSISEKPEILKNKQSETIQMRQFDPFLVKIENNFDSNFFPFEKDYNKFLSPHTICKNSLNNFKFNENHTCLEKNSFSSLLLKSNVSASFYHQDDCFLVWGGSKNFIGFFSLNFYNVSNRRKEKVIEEMTEGAISFLSFEENRRLLICGNQSGIIRIYDISTLEFKEKHKIEVKKGKMIFYVIIFTDRYMEICEKGKDFLCISLNDEKAPLKIVDLHGETIRDIKNPTGSFCWSLSFFYDDDKTHILTAFSSSSIQDYDLKNNTFNPLCKTNNNVSALHVMMQKKKRKFSILFSEQGGNKITIINSSNGELIRENAIECLTNIYDLQFWNKKIIVAVGSHAKLSNLIIFIKISNLSIKHIVDLGECVPVNLQKVIIQKKQRLVCFGKEKNDQSFVVLF